jgi:hypothetical protein
MLLKSPSTIGALFGSIASTMSPISISCFFSVVERSVLDANAIVQHRNGLFGRTNGSMDGNSKGVREENPPIEQLFPESRLRGGQRPRWRARCAWFRSSGLFRVPTSCTTRYKCKQRKRMTRVMFSSVADVKCIRWLENSRSLDRRILSRRLL